MLKIIHEAKNRKEFQLAVTLEKNKKYEKLLLHCKAWSNIYPNDPYAWHCLGRAYIYCNKTSDAIKNFKKLLSMYPQFLVAYIDLGNAYCLIKDFTNAKNTYLQATAKFPYFAFAWYNLGVVHNTLGEKENVIQIYDILKEIDQEIAEQYKTELMTN